MFQQVMHRLEHRLHARDFAQRVVRPFVWGLEHLGAEAEVRDPMDWLRVFNREAHERSYEFFTPPPCANELFQFDDFWLRFPSAITTPHATNNEVSARFYGANGSKSAVIVSPQWNAQEDSHVGLCTALNCFGISALRLSLPYHDRRKPADLQRAEYLISPNLGLTIQAVRQAVHDIRRAADWLFAQGYERVAVMGSSIGSCVSWLAFIHDERLEAGAFNMVSSYFGDVVWRAVTTSHIRQSLETVLDAKMAREVWLSLSPSFYADRVLPRVRRRAMFVSARYDLTFLPDLSDIFIEDSRRHGVPHETAYLRCGHYTIGRTPFKYLDAYYILNFFRRTWSHTVR
jgi:hypothetical protein